MTNRPRIDEDVLTLLEQRWGLDPEQPYGRLALTLGDDENFEEFVDVLTGDDDEDGRAHNLHDAFLRCEQKLSYEQVAVALGDAPGRGALSPAEFLARFAREALA